MALLSETMSAPVLVATPLQTLEEVECHFEAVSGLPVVDSSLRCVGVVVKNDRAKASHGVSSPYPLFSLSLTQLVPKHTHNKLLISYKSKGENPFLSTDPLLLVTAKNKDWRSNDLSSHHTSIR